MLKVTIAFLAFILLGMSVNLSLIAQDVAYRDAMAHAVRAAAGEVLPSVVTIEMVGVNAGGEGEVEQDAPTSGVVVDSSGFILASSLVVARPAASILVVLPDGTRHAAKVISRDHHRDLVLLKIEADDKLVPIVFPAQSDLRIGQTTVAVGRYGRQRSPMVSTGVLSGIDRLDGIALQTDARVSPAFYGAPLVDLTGSVLGILIPAVAEDGAPDATSWYDSGIAFAVPTTIITQKLERLKKGEDIKKGLIGIVVKSEDPYDNDTELAAVRNRSPAEIAGLKPGDEVVSVAGTKVRRHQEIKQVLGRFDAGESIDIEYRRDQKTQRVELTLADSIPPLEPQRLGIIVSQQVGENDENSAVVVEAIVPGSPADGHCEPGDLIRKLGEAEIKDVQTLRRQMISAEPKKELALSLTRKAADRDLKLTPASVDGPSLTTMPKSFISAEAKAWTINELKLPDAANVAAIVVPERKENGDSESLKSLGLLILLQGPGQPEPKEELKSWAEKASELGVVVCAIASEDTKRWQPKEIDIVTRFAAAAIKQADIDKSSVAVAAPGALSGGSSEASDSMALAVALSATETFRGAAVSEKTRAPAVRLRQNDAAQSLQFLLPIENADDTPPWATALQLAGYPIVRGGAIDIDALLRWVRLLQAI